VITDPPYGVDWDTNSRDKEKDLPGTVANDGDIDEAIELWDAVVGELRRVLTDDGHLYAFADWRTEHSFRLVLENYGFDIRNVLVWDKGSMGIGDLSNNWGYSHEFIIFATNGDRADPLTQETRNVLQHGRIPRESYEHPTQKPESLLVEIIQTATGAGDLILDPFMGSGTTAVAAIQNDRDYVGFEIDAENYREVVERRIGEAKRQWSATVNQEANDD